MSDIIEFSCKVDTKRWYWIPTGDNRGVFLNALLKFENRELELGCIDNSGNYSIFNKMDVMTIKKALVKKNAVTTMKYYVKPIIGGLATAVGINIFVFLAAEQIVIGPVKMFLVFLALCAASIALNTTIFFFSVSISPLSRIMLETETNQSFYFYIEQDCFEHVIETMKYKGICVQNI